MCRSVIEQRYFSEMIPTLAGRAATSTVSWLAFRNSALRQHLLKSLNGAYGHDATFVADPAFEAVFGWETAPQTMSKLGGPLLHPRLVSAMDAPASQYEKEYRFPKDRRPYTHQLASWKLLQHKSTGSHGDQRYGFWQNRMLPSTNSRSTCPRGRRTQWRPRAVSVPIERADK